MIRWAALSAPAAVGGLLVALDRPVGWVVVALTIVRLQVAAAAPTVDDRLDRRMREMVRAIERILTGLLSAIPALLTLGAWVLASILRQDPLARTPGWIPRERRQHPDRAEQRPWGPSPYGRPPAWRRAAVPLAAGGAIIVVVLAVYSTRDRTPTSVPAAAGPGIPEAVADQPEIEQVWQEEGAIFERYEPHPLLGWQLPSSAPGSVVNVADRRRVTVQASDRGPVVWIFGGSTAFGSNQRDQHTIAAEFSRAAREQGTPVQVVNWGRHAYTSYQEAQLLSDALRETAAPPDLVVFYDGYNDVAVGLGSSFLEAPAELPPRAPSIVEGAEAPPTSAPPRWMSPDERFDRIVDDFDRANRLARSVATPEGIEVVQVWQPSAFSRSPTSDERAQLEAAGIDQQAFDALAHAHEEIRRRLPSSVIDLGDVLDDATSVYLDQVHTNELGAQLVGEALAASLEPQLRTLPS